MESLERTLAHIDRLHGEDPAVERVDGRDVPAELAYAERMSARLAELVPDASEALRIAVRAQHLCRFRLPRSDFPGGRAGYKRWRTRAAFMHAEVLGEVLVSEGYDEPFVTRVQELVLKKRLRTDEEVQALEDVACLVFLEHYFADFAEKHGDDKVVDILRKTWTKMSPRGQRAALDLELGDREQALVRRALAGD